MQIIMYYFESDYLAIDELAASRWLTRVHKGFTTVRVRGSFACG
jgi:hypothetical protein